MTENIASGLTAGVAKSYFGPTFYSNLTDDVLDHPDLEMYEAGILYGREFRKKAMVFTIEGGIGYINGIDRGCLIWGREYTKVKISNVCIPLESRIRIELCRYFGVGVLFIGNVNAKKSFWGGGFDIQIGCV